MTNLHETAKAAAKTALGLLQALTSHHQPGTVHLTGGAPGSRASSLDEDLDELLQEIQRRRGLA